MLINVRIKPCSGRQEIIRGHDGSFLVFLMSAPEHNKTNAELIDVLHEYFNRPARVKIGLRSRNKIIEILD